jgi:SAM-dependent methyltransferase
LPRHRILALWFEKHIDFLRDADILYFAPGRSERIWLKRHKVSCVSADLYSKTVDLKLDIQSTGLPDESYDVIVCNHVLEHVDDFRKALKEMYRILRPGGSFICSFPMDPKVELLDEDPAVETEEDRIRRFGQNDHKRVFGMKADRFLTEAGFAVERIDGKDYPKEILPVVGPADYDINLLFRCVKRG